jgi:hypothetical protein
MDINFERFQIGSVEYNYAPFLGVSATIDGVFAGHTGSAPWCFSNLNKAQLESLIRLCQKALNQDLSLNKREIIKRTIACAEETLAKM